MILSLLRVKCFQKAAHASKTRPEFEGSNRKGRVRLSTGIWYPHSMFHSLDARNSTHHVPDLFSIYQASSSWHVAQRHDPNLSKAVLICGFGGRRYTRMGISHPDMHAQTHSLRSSAEGGIFSTASRAQWIDKLEWWPSGLKNVSSGSMVAS